MKKYLNGGEDFIKASRIEERLSHQGRPERMMIKDILAKSLSIQTLTLEETACLLNVKDADLWAEMCEAALAVKRKVYDNRIVTFAPLYISNFCVNDCLYCGFRVSNKEAERKRLSLEELKKETETLAGKIGHKRLIVVCGEHYLSGIDYITKSIETIYRIKVKANKGFGQIRRVNVNAPPFTLEDLKLLRQAGIGTYQVFQETYRRRKYEQLHPKYTVKGNYLWRLYVMHRAFEAGIDDVGLGALFGLDDWRYEVMGLVTHNRELEDKFGVGAHTISFPRLEPAANTPFTEEAKDKVSNEDFKKLITVIRLAVPHTGLIITARENAQIRRESLSLGVTQTDASSKIGIGAYQKSDSFQEGSGQQFLLGDTRSLDEVIREFCQLGYITSFCTAGYRCGRRGKCIMQFLRTGKESNLCKLNAVLTFREWLDDFSSRETKAAAKKVINREISEIKESLPGFFPHFLEYYQRIESGERDLYF